jgi:hypothetical protein
MARRRDRGAPVGGREAHTDGVMEANAPLCSIAIIAIPDGNISAIAKATSCLDEPCTLLGHTRSSSLMAWATVSATGHPEINGLCNLPSTELASCSRMEGSAMAGKNAAAARTACPALLAGPANMHSSRWRSTCMPNTLLATLNRLYKHRRQSQQQHAVLACGGRLGHQCRQPLTQASIPQTPTCPPSSLVPRISNGSQFVTQVMLWPTLSCGKVRGRAFSLSGPITCNGSMSPCANEASSNAT